MNTAQRIAISWRDMRQDEPPETGYRKIPTCRLCPGVARVAGLCVAHLAELVDLETTPGQCTYCGEDANTRDHLLPLPWTGPAQRPFIPTVPACRECNSLLGAQFLPFASDRRAEIAGVLKRRLFKDLRVAPLTDAQLRERYSGRMLHRMRRRQLDHDTAVRRIAHALGHPITHAPTTEGAQ